MAPPTAIDLGVGDTESATLVDLERLTIDGIAARRSKAPKIGGGLAVFASAEMFKADQGPNRPRAREWDHRITKESQSRQPSSLKNAAKYLTKPGIINLGGGLPSSAYFPFSHVEIKVPQPKHGFSEQETIESGIIKRAGKHDIAEGKAEYDLHVALNYGQSTGSAQMVRFLTEHTQMVHQPPYQDWAITMSVGSTSALDIAFRIFIERGDCILTEEYSFSSAIEAARPLGAKWIGVSMDAEGLLPSSLDSILSEWDPSKHGGAAKPFLLYTVPTGNNPTGATASLERRKEVYRVAQKHDLYILEDEPYYFLQMQPYTGRDAPSFPPPSSHDAFLQALVPSYLSLDTDGRVMRLESFSKIIAPGMRIGWIVASAQIVERFARASEVSTQNPSGPSQIMLFKLLEEAWGHAGFFDWLVYIRLEYTRRRDNMVDACERSLPTEVSSWVAPMAGMFIFIQIDWKKHPAYGQITLVEIEEEIFQAAIAHGTLVSKGSWFRAEQGNPGDQCFVRMTFAAADDLQIQEAVKRFATALKSVFGLKMVENGTAVNGSDLEKVNGGGHEADARVQVLV